ncbi:MAG: hypothetical protein VX834_01795 [Myxococcota bacterium]|nr:hypothetical protein [Myxococcota bacterium]
MHLLLILTSILPASSQAPSSPQIQSPAFWEHWGDGRAEIAGYKLEFDRYGEKRHGQAVTIFVTETFDHDQHVKVDRRATGPQYPVMKLNLVRDFQTGIYDYNTMLSAFVSLETTPSLSKGAPAKISFSSQEWCGHVYHQLLFDEDKAHETVHSYFDREADQARTLSLPTNTVSLDTLWHWARGLAGPGLEAGESITVPALPTLLSARLNHHPVSLGRVTMTRGGKTQRVHLDAGTFDVEVFTAELEGGPQWRFEVEAAAPHRIIRWTNSKGEQATFQGSERLAYWKLSGPSGHEKLKALGIAPLP